MKITQVEAIPFRIPFYPDLALRFAYRTSNSADHVLVRVHTDEGITGVAEAPARPQIYGETQQSIVTVIHQFFGPGIQGMNPMDLLRVHGVLDKIPYNFCAKAAIDIALHDVIGKALNLPVHQLLGGRLTDSIPLSWMVGIRSREEMVAECLQFAAKGIKGFKVKSGIDLEEDVKTFGAIREALGGDAFLYMDANLSFPTVQKGIAIVDALHRYDMALIEEPMPLENRKHRIRFAERIPIPVMGDESCVTPAAVRREIEAGSVGIVLVKIARTGFFKSRDIIAICRSANIPVMIGSQGDSSIGALASAQLCAAFDNIIPPAEISYHLRMKGELLLEPPVIEDGCLRVPDGPGIGCAIDERALERFRL